AWGLGMGAEAVSGEGEAAIPLPPRSEPQGEPEPALEPFPPSEPSPDAGAPPEPTEAVPPPPEPLGTGRGASIGAAILVAAAVALIVSGSAPYWTRALGLAPPMPTAATASPTQRIEALWHRLAALESRPAPPAEAPAVMNGLAGRVAELERKTEQLGTDLNRRAGAAGSPGGEGPAAAALAQRLDAIEGKVQALQGDVENARRASAAAVGPERIAALSDRIDEATAELRAMQAKLSMLVDLPQRMQALGQRVESSAGQELRTAFVLAAGQLEAALDSGQPFTSELEAVRRLAGKDADLAPILAQLEDSAGEGVPTLAQLRTRFEDMALAVAQAATAPVEGRWIDRGLARLRSVVTVRPVGGDVEGDGAEARLARAEARLSEGDLAAGVSELDGLTGPAAEAAAPWLADARARVAADKAIQRLRERALARIAPAGQ